MLTDNKIDELIKAGWNVIESDSDTVAFQNWENQVRDCLCALVGPDHTYTRQFEDYVNGAEATNVLAGCGILIAAKEQMPEFGPAPTT
jgi:hypothetical protein